MQKLQLPIEELLNEFGKGIGMTGAGSVASLTALSGAEMLVSVCKLTLGKDKYAAQHEDVRAIQDKLENSYIPQLKEIMENDGVVVGQMVKYRIKRDREADEAKKEEYKQLALIELEKATDTMMGLTRICLDIFPDALFLYNAGLKSAKGDSAVVLSNLLSAAYSGLCTTLMNIQSAKNSDWVGGKHTDLEAFFGRLHEYQFIFTGKITSIYNKVVGDAS